MELIITIYNVFIAMAKLLCVASSGILFFLSLSAKTVDDRNKYLLYSIMCAVYAAILTTR